MKISNNSHRWFGGMLAAVFAVMLSSQVRGQIYIASYPEFGPTQTISEYST